MNRKTSLDTRRNSAASSNVAKGSRLGVQSDPTAELREAMHTVCAFLNGSGGMVLFGVRPDGAPKARTSRTRRLREISQAFDRSKPPVNIPARATEPLKSR